jgi:uncharacterized protein YndB with AHSA1/START domain
MPYTFTLTATIPASPAEIYQAWLDSVGHSEMTGGEAEMSDRVGAEVSAWDGYISGRNLELVPDERIIQSWRTSEFADEQEDSVITVVLEEIGDATLLMLEHSNVPDEQRSYEEGGWQSNYFEPMVAYFGKRTESVAEPAPAQAPLRSAPKKGAAKVSAGKAGEGLAQKEQKQDQSGSTLQDRAQAREADRAQAREADRAQAREADRAQAREADRAQAREADRAQARKAGRPEEQPGSTEISGFLSRPANGPAEPRLVVYWISCRRCAARLRGAWAGAGSGPPKIRVKKLPPSG